MLQMNLLDWMKETGELVHHISKNSCRWIGAAINQISPFYDMQVRLFAGSASDAEAEAVIFKAAELRNAHCKRLHKRKRDLIWNGETIEA